jgi:hypothetical protein
LRLLLRAFKYKRKPGFQICIQVNCRALDLASALFFQGY